MDYFTLDQWIIVILIFLLGLFLGMAFLASGKWKRRYREEHRRCDELERDHKKRVEELERENETLRRDGREMDSLRRSAAKNPPRDRDERGPV